MLLLKLHSFSWCVQVMTDTQRNMFSYKVIMAHMLSADRATRLSHRSHVCSPDEYKSSIYSPLSKYYALIWSPPTPQGNI